MKKWKGIIMMGGKHTMKNQWKRSAVVATVLVFVCAAVYLNWRYAGNVAEQAAANQGTEQQVLEQENGESTKVLGDAALVGGEVVDASQAASASSGYFDTARLSRQQSRDNALSLLREAAAQEGAEQAAVDEANQAIQTIAGYTMLESQVESLIVAKGYADCVAFIGENALSLAVAAPEGGLTDTDTARIVDVVHQTTGFTADQVKIIAVEPQA